MGGMDFDDSEGGWKRNPVVGIVAGGIVFILFIMALSKICCSGADDEKIVGDEVTMICPHCKHVYQVARDSVNVKDATNDDAFQSEAGKVPCPECGKKDSVVAATCNKCGKPYAPPKTAEALKNFKCPHCGKKPWGK